jgi:hypothetical protein
MTSNKLSSTAMMQYKKIQGGLAITNFGLLLLV